ncbi:YceI family protein [Methylocella sp.]|uniref:YceI family protein n=1 Tax=Methylocella sp. TaxID=1978226 RepID=UPI0035AF6179
MSDKLSNLLLAAALAVPVLLAGPAAAPAFAQAPMAAPPQVAPEAAAYAVDPNHTQALFNVSHFGVSNYWGVFSGVSGTLDLDPKAPEKSAVSVSIPVKSVATTSEKLTGELTSAEWLDAGKYPEMTFRSTKLIPTGEGTGAMDGEFTLRGVTRPVTLKVKFTGAAVNPMTKKVNVGFEATGTLKRSEFGVDKFVPLVSDEVSIVITAAFEKKG